ncbi:BgTH12-02534 [Blumeria graminis f. sp. triticale]|uniref:Bgt-1555 n=4 Tax=sordariomyceta TaxID=715989 RepID=A0A381LEZ2_BLUGR|nr:BgTH12-02534 [Blumeria graminis f. sp. triticale]VDB86361.1 Bgt-1555 [Blumeria graminis f. sp. tritici]
MAAPASVTIKDLSGKWSMDKKLSDSPEPSLTLQGVGWVKRKAIATTTIALDVKQYLDASNITHIDIKQTASGIPGTTETRVLDFEKAKHSDHVFGEVEGRCQWITLDKIADPLPEHTSTPEEVEFLSKGWICDESENGGPNGERHIDSYVQNDSNKWLARQIWGFSMIEGQRRYVRRVVLKKYEPKTPDHILFVTLVYNYES